MAEKTPAEVMRQPLCAIYARVSTEDQDCTLQLNELREFADRRGWRVTAEYVDTGWSGSRNDRPQLKAILKDAAAHRFDCIIVWKIDRFGRSCADLLDYIRQLQSWGVRFMAITQSLDTDDANPTSRLLITILAAVAEFERSMIRERVKAGVKAAQAKGVQCGRRAKVWDRDQAVQLHLQGKTVRAIAKQLGVGPTSVFKAIEARGRTPAASSPSA